MKFLIFEDNGGDYCRTLVAASGERLAQSMRFASYQEATRAARIARAGAASARSTTTPPTPGPRTLSADGRSRSNATTLSGTGEDHRLKPGEIGMDNKHVDQGKGREKGGGLADRRQTSQERGSSRPGQRLRKKSRCQGR